MIVVFDIVIISISTPQNLHLYTALKEHRWNNVNMRTTLLSILGVQTFVYVRNIFKTNGRFALVSLWECRSCKHFRYFKHVHILKFDVVTVWDVTPANITQGYFVLVVQRGQTWRE